MARMEMDCNLKKFQVLPAQLFFGLFFLGEIIWYFSSGAGREQFHVREEVRKHIFEKIRPASPLASNTVEALASDHLAGIGKSGRN